MSNCSIVFSSIASTTAVLKSRWALVKVVVGFLSFGFVLAILVAVVAGKLKREREGRDYF